MLQSQCYSGMMKNINHITQMGLNRNIGCIEIFYDKFKERFVKGVEP